MKKLIIISVLIPLFLISCGKSEEVKTFVNPPVVEKQIVSTVLVIESGSVTTGSGVEVNTAKIEEVSTGVVSES